VTPSSAESSTLTTGVLPNGPFKGTSSLVLEVFCTDGSALPCPAPGDQEDLRVIGSVTDVRCKRSIASDGDLCPSANSAGGKDYAGQIQFNAMIRITDAYNGSPDFTTHATLVDLQNPVTTLCTSTSANATIGSSCNVSTTAEANCPPACDLIKEGRKANVEVGQIYILDGGTDGVTATTPNTVFARQGIYIP
jgi:hypothetical protein